MGTTLNIKMQQLPVPTRYLYKLFYVKKGGPVEWCLSDGIRISSVADPGCLSRTRILIFTHPGSRIQKQQQKRGVKKICCHNFLCRHKFHKIANYFSFEVLKKKIWANFQRIIELFTQKIVTKLSKIWIWDPGSGKKPIPDPGSRGQKSSGSATLRIRVADPHSFHRDPDPAF
jgi:hypothetical protein